MEQKDREHFDNLLLADEPSRMSRGTDTLMKIMGGGRMPPMPAQPREGVTS